MHITPLKNWKRLKRGFVYKQKYPAGFGSLTGKPHLGLDLLVPTGTQIFAPEDGVAEKRVGKQMGNAIYFKGSKLIRFMHLSKYGMLGKVLKGDVIGFTGNTGASSTPHVHIDVSKGKLNINSVNSFIDPELYFDVYRKVGSLFKAEGSPKVYILGVDQRLYHIADEKDNFTFKLGKRVGLWGGFENVKELSKKEIASIKKGRVLKLNK